MMQMKFVAQQRVLGLSECERLCGRRSTELEELASRAGWPGVPGTGSRISVPVGTALNMLVLSIAKRHGVETQAMAGSLPGLRDEALLELGADISNWSFHGPDEAEQQFWPMLYGSREAVRPRIAPLLGCYSHSRTRELRFFTPSDIERVTDDWSQQGRSDRTPRFTIFAQSLAEEIQATCGSPLFTAKPA
jgi:hypothetical protein